jgi:hypothetical protein
MMERSDFPKEDEELFHTATLFPVIPNIRNAYSMPPIVLKFDGYSNGIIHKPCNIPCINHGEPPTVAIRMVKPITSTKTKDPMNWFESENKEADIEKESPSSLSNNILPHERHWSFTFSMEGVHYYENLRIDPDAWKRGSFYATTSFQSEIPLPYYSAAEYNISNPPLEYELAEKAALFLARNCGSKNQREQIVQTLILDASAFAPDFRVDSLGMCLKHAAPPAGVSLEGSKSHILRQYLFYLAFENQCEADYITEKLWGALDAGTLPIYYGDANIHAHVPAHSIISVHDFLLPNKNDHFDMKPLAQHLQQIARNRSLYESFHEWRKNPLPPHFRAKYDFTQTHSTCRTCRWAYARFYGLGWNHSTQSIQELQIGPRQACRTKNKGIVSRPFQEYWTYTNGTTIPEINSFEYDDDKAICQEDSDNHIYNRNDDRVLWMANGRIRRTIYAKDGIVDFRVQNSTGMKMTTATTKAQDMEDPDSMWDGKIQLQIRTPLRPQWASQSIVTNGHVRLQDDMSRYTILVSPPYAASVLAMTKIIPVKHDPAEEMVTGTLELHTFPVRIRIIVEDVDTFHKGADSEENFFGSLMKHDFYTPLEKFVDMGKVTRVRMDDAVS